MQAETSHETFQAVLEPFLGNNDEACTAAANEGLPVHGSLEQHHPHANTPWPLTTSILLGDMFGLGTLSLPADFARLGWLAALSVLSLLSAGGVYSGSLYTRLCTSLPSAVMFDQVGYAAMGRTGQMLVYATVYLTISCEPVIFHLTSMLSVQQVIVPFGWTLNSWVLSLGVAAVALPLAQVQHLHDLGWVAILGTIGMLVATSVVTAKLLFSVVPTKSISNTELVSTAGARSAFVGVMDLVFTFGGQVNWMRYISSMRKRSDFIKAVSVTTSFMSVMYLLVGVVGYAALGRDLDLTKPVTSLLAPDMWTAVMNVGLFVHCIIAYQININVWAAAFVQLLLPQRHQEVAQGQTAWAKTIWFCVTLLCIVVSGLSAVAFPFFNVVMAVIASFGDLASMFGLPALFALKLLKRMSSGERGLCWALVATSLVLSLAGAGSAIAMLVQAKMAPA